MKALSREREGLLLCLASAAGFGAMAILAKQAYADGLEVAGLLALRFGIAAPLLWAIVAWRRPRLDRRALLAGAALGLVYYSLQAGLFFGALTRIDAGLAALLLYAYPALVALAALATGRERAHGRRLAALGVASAGVALVLLGGGVGGGELDPLGAGLALGAAVAYAGYLLIADRTVAAASPLVVAAMVCTGAWATFTVVALLLGDLSIDGGVGWAAAMALVSTVMPLAFLFAGLARVGPTTASILSTVEPPVTVALAFVVFGETLSAVQLAGGALVLAAVVLLQLPATRAAAAPAAPVAASTPGGPGSRAGR